MRYSEGVATIIRKAGPRKGRKSYDGFLHYYDEKGKRKSVHRERNSRSAAKEAIRLVRNRLELGGPKALETDVTTFAQLADYAEKEMYVEAEYNEDGEKLCGVRDASTYKAHLKHLREFFGAKKLRTIKVRDLTNYRAYRLRSTRPGPDKTRLSIKKGTVARELTTLRAMLNESKRNRWIDENPFKLARKNEVIKSSDRATRSLFLTFGQEIQLLKACEREDRRHLKSLIIVAVDTGARFGELIHLKKSQLDFSDPGWIRGLINYKNMGGDKQLRNAVMTPRVREALLDLINRPPKKVFKALRSGEKPSGDLVFGISDNVRTAWRGALKDAGLKHLGLNFHDLRHTPGTRVKKMIDLLDIANALGHRDPKTTAQIYVNHTQQDLIDFAQAVEKAVAAGYRQVLAEEATPDQESNLVS